jgi:hypothetical protein
MSDQAKDELAVDNEQTILTFADWLHGYICAGFTEENHAACVSVVREFAEYIAPKQLSDSTVAEIKAFEQKAKTDRRLDERELRATLMGMGYFRSFRKEFLKPLPKGKIPATEARRLLAYAEIRRVRR